MTSTTGESQRRDPGDRTRDIDGKTGELHLPTSSAPGVYAAAVPTPWTMSGLLGGTLCIAVPILLAVLILTVVEEANDSPVVSDNAMRLLIAAGIASWTAVTIVACRDRVVRCYRALRVSNETVQSRQMELYRRQDHLVHRFNDLANRQVEQMQLLREVAADVAKIRREISDAIGVADADAELSLRQAVNGPRPPGGGLYIVPPES